MLQNLHISHYALIDALDIDFSNGFSVITGETGAGKSIILGALGLLLGQRADSKAIKPGASKCCVEGHFDISQLQLEEIFAANDIDSDGKECIVRREVTTNGKSRAFINDTPVPIAVLKNVTAHLIDIHSQHQNLLMGQEHFLLDILDTFGHHDDILTDYLQVFKQWHTACSELEELQQRAQQDKSDMDYMQFQLQQIEEVQLTAGEQEELEKETEMLSHAEEIKTVLYQTSYHLTEDSQNPVSLLKTDIQQLESISKVFDKGEELAERMESVRIELKDIAEELTMALEHIDFDPQRLEYVDNRLSTIYSLEQKHHVSSVEELIALAQDLRARIDQIENIDEEISQKTAEVERLQKEVLAKGKVLTERRKEAGTTMAADLARTLQSLGMPAARLHFDFTARTRPEASGLDNVAFLFSANKNMPEQDVTEIASGGEIARLMLSLKSLIARHQHLPTIIFDEIDTGVSGTMAEKMANVMQKMASYCQVLCITHLPQIAALGTHHYRVFKTENSEGTSSHIHLLDTEARIREIANMLSGAEMTEAAINNAKSLLSNGQK